MDYPIKIARFGIIGAAWMLLAIMAGCDAGTDGQASQAGTVPTTSTTVSVAPATVVFMGDSITAYWPVDNYFPGAVDVGIGGQVTAQMLARFNTDVISRHPSIVVLLGGTNDILNLHTADTSNLFTMVQSAESAGAHVIVGTLPPPPDIASIPPEALGMYVQYNNEIMYGAGAYGYTVVNYHDAMVLADGSQNPALFQTASVHPNDAGYDVMASLLRPLLK